MDAQAAAGAWVDAWDRAWRAKDESALEPVYAEDAVHRSHPDREPHSPIEYARSAFADEGDDLELSWGEPLVAGNRAAVEWWAALTESGELVTLAGTSCSHSATTVASSSNTTIGRSRPAAQLPGKAGAPN